MNERDIFMAALERATAEERSNYLGVACAGDTTLRERVEGLLQMHEQTGDFLQKPLVERLAEGVAALQEAETAHDPSISRIESNDFGFLSPSDQPGSLGRLGHYEVREVIGSGGMGIVLRAFDERLHRVVAIKVMSAQLATNAAARKRFQREARAAAAVCHDHIVTIHAVEKSNDLPYLVMQCVSGMSLQQRIDRDGPLALHEILRIGMQTAAGLAAAHAQGLIHRDIKPANILLENGVERVKITDFGLARAAADASVSQTGIVAGTPQYMSPEQARGDSVDCRTDLFSLGSVLYAMCTGRAPFRAGNSMAVLKRLCDDAPSPIRDANADVPDWLVALIDKLQAKNPDNRYQSAAEVGEILGQRLAQLQHSTPLPPLATAKSAPPHPRRRRGWAISAAAALALLLLGISLTEATGVTQVVPTVIRIVTGEGTLVVETDPDVQVTVEGNGDLVFNLAGGQSIHVPSGRYRMTATKDGRPVPLEKDLVTISRGSEQVVRVRLEREPFITAAPKGEKAAFVVLGTQGGEVWKHDTLADAVHGASAGDTIEIRGNGPFVTPPIKIERRSLAIRAGKGFWPVIKADPEEQGTILLDTNAALALEGLEFQWVGAKAFDGAQPETRLFLAGRTSKARLDVANCRFLTNQAAGDQTQINCISVMYGAFCQLRNCQLVIGGQPARHGFALNFHGSPQGELLVDNCLMVGHGVNLAISHAEPTKAALKRNTSLGVNWQFLGIALYEKVNPSLQAKTLPLVQIRASANIFDGTMRVNQFAGPLAAEKILNTAEAEKFLTKLVDWQENKNLYLLPMDGDLLRLQHKPPVRPTKTMADWMSFWGMKELDSQRGQAKFQGGDMVLKARLTPELLTPDDFRLRPDSDGYKAGKDGKDLGADVDLVGPGAAYERWKRTPEYQQWLEETGQKKSESQKTNPN